MKRCNVRTRQADLIEVAATAHSPACRIADLRKFRFAQAGARDAKKNQHVSEVKEVRLRPRTDEHDWQVRVRAARRFLQDGHKVKVEVRSRGREASHPEVARAQIASIASGVADIAMVERPPSLEGRTMFAILARGRAQVHTEQSRPVSGGGQGGEQSRSSIGRVKDSAELIPGASSGRIRSGSAANCTRLSTLRCRSDR